MKKIVISIAVVVAIVLVVGFAPLMDVPYQDTETYYVDEPYEATETYYESVPLSYEVSRSYEDEGTYTYHYYTQIGDLVWEGTREVPFPIGCLVLKNIDDASGEFDVKFTFSAIDKGMADFYESVFGEEGIPWTEQYTRSDSINLEPGQIGTAKAEVRDIDMDRDKWTWEYEVSPGTKEVAKDRTVTKYRQVEQEKTVTRYKKGSIFQYLLSRF